VNIQSNLKFAACLGLFLAAATPCRIARAEVPLVEKDGWTFSFDGRVGAFLSVGKGDDFPEPVVNPNAPTSTHEVMGSTKGPGVPDVGWKSSEVQDTKGKYFAMRVRSGMVGNVLGFGLSRAVTDTTTIKGYISIWSTIETLGRDKWAPVIPEAREGYFNVTGPWGSATVGRTFGWFGRISTEIDRLYGHPYGVGLPCTDELGPACGHIGTGVAYPGYSAGFSYSTPSLGGLKLNVGVYDPIVFAPSWKRAPLLRPEGALTFERKVGASGLIKFALEGLYQPLARVAVDPVTMAKSDVSTSVYGGAGGVRVEAGPVRLGAAVFHGRGIGMTYALQNSSVSLNPQTYELRTFTGVYGQAGLVLDQLQIAVGAGSASANQLPNDRVNPNQSVIKRQIGVSAAAYYNVTDSVVVGIDYFRFMARWYGAPNSVLDPNTNQLAVIDGTLLPGEKQNIDFINAGVTYHW
jgi:hypothetical protein